MTYLFTSVLKIVVAVICGCLIGIERTIKGRVAGIRTHILVCMSSALTMIIGLYTVDVLGYDSDPIRIGAQVVSGIGFLGVGTILVKGRNEVMGVTTAAGLWTTAIIGLSIGIGYYIPAIITAFLSFLTIYIVSALGDFLDRKKKYFRFYIETNNIEYVNNIIYEIQSMYKVSELDIISPKSSISGNVGIEVTIFAKNEKLQTIQKTLQDIKDTIIVIESI